MNTQQLLPFLQMMMQSQGGGQNPFSSPMSGGMPMKANSAPQIPLAQKSQGGIMQPPQSMGRSLMPGGGALAQATNGMKNITSLYDGGKKAYNGISGLFDQTPPALNNVSPPNNMSGASNASGQMNGQNFMGDGNYSGYGQQGSNSVFSGNPASPMFGSGTGAPMAQGSGNTMFGANGVAAGSGNGYFSYPQQQGWGLYNNGVQGSQLGGSGAIFNGTAGGSAGGYGMADGAAAGGGAQAGGTAAGETAGGDAAANSSSSSSVWDWLMDLL